MSKGFLLFALIGMFQASPHAEILVIQGGSLFDGTGSDPTPNISVIIEGNRIREIGQGLSIPPGARVIDARDHMILPGLIDPHIHFRAWMPQFFYILASPQHLIRQIQPSGFWSREKPLPKAK